MPYFIVDVLSADPEISLDADASIPSLRLKSPVFGDEKKNKVRTSSGFRTVMDCLSWVPSTDSYRAPAQLNLKDTCSIDDSIDDSNNTRSFQQPVQNGEQTSTMLLMDQQAGSNLQCSRLPKLLFRLFTLKTFLPLINSILNVRQGLTRKVSFIIFPWSNPAVFEAAVFA